MPDKLVVVGAGGFGRETLDIVDAVNSQASDPRWLLLGVVDDAPSSLNLDRLRARDVAYLGSLSAIPRAAWVAIAVGSPQTRQRLADQLADRCAGFATLVHPAAVIGTRTRISGGVIVCGNASVGTNAFLGRHVQLNPHAVVGHDSQLDDFVSVNPNATISGECKIGATTLVGAGAVVLQGLEVAAGSVIGAAACVTKTVARTATVVGVPARPMGAERDA